MYSLSQRVWQRSVKNYSVLINAYEDSIAITTLAVRHFKNLKIWQGCQLISWAIKGLITSSYNHFIPCQLELNKACNETTNPCSALVSLEVTSSSFCLYFTGNLNMYSLCLNICVATSIFYFHLGFEWMVVNSTIIKFTKCNRVLIG